MVSNYRYGGVGPAGGYAPPPPPLLSPFPLPPMPPIAYTSAPGGMAVGKFPNPRSVSQIISTEEWRGKKVRDRGTRYGRLFYYSRLGPNSCSVLVTLKQTLYPASPNCDK